VDNILKNIYVERKKSEYTLPSAIDAAKWMCIPRKRALAHTACGVKWQKTSLKVENSSDEWAAYLKVASRMSRSFFFNISVCAASCERQKQLTVYNKDRNFNYIIICRLPSLLAQVEDNFINSYSTS
jgi:hypothetical protein